MGAEQTLWTSPEIMAPMDWSPNGFLLFQQGGIFKRDLYALRVSNDARVEGKPMAIAVDPNFDERDGKFSPDGGWIAYQSNETATIRDLRGAVSIAGPQDPGDVDRRHAGAMAARWTGALLSRARWQAHVRAGDAFARREGAPGWRCDSLVPDRDTQSRTIARHQRSELRSVAGRESLSTVHERRGPARRTDYAHPELEADTQVEICSALQIDKTNRYDEWKITVDEELGMRLKDFLLSEIDREIDRSRRALEAGSRG